MAEMKIRELSIGDWVRYRDADANVRVSDIYSNGDVFIVGDEDSGISESVNAHHHIEPIPLTPEILEKNGFVDYEVGKGWYVLNVADDLRVWLHRNSHDWTFQLMKWSPLSTHEIGKVFIKHTHQLQQALRLAGVEKDIEL